jgi:hypothetical protein
VASRQVTCINKRGDHYNPHERIENVGGAGWKHGESESYYVSVGGRSVKVIVALHNNREYLKTEADGYSPDNLLALPECR